MRYVLFRRFSTSIVGIGHILLSAAGSQEQQTATESQKIYRPHRTPP
jgi:hypothetical protein